MSRPVWLKREAVNRCGRCGRRQAVPVAAVGYRCRFCDADWRWAVCGTCGLLQVQREELPAVECQRCHTVHVSWWKTADSETIAEEVAERRHYADVRGRRVRRALVAVVALVALLLGGALLVLLA